MWVLRNIFLLLILFVVGFFILAPTLNAQETPSATPPASEEDSQLPTAEPPPPNEFFRGKVLKILDEGVDTSFGGNQPFQLVEVELLSGPEKGEKFEIKHISSFGEFKEHQKVKPGETVIVVKTPVLDDFRYFITEKYRLPSVVILFTIFLVFTVIFAGIKGLGSIAGLAFSILVIIQFIIPNIADGKDPLFISLIGALLIATVSIYIAHGFSKRTTIALASTIITIFIAAALATFFVSTAKLFGLGSEEAFYLQQGPLADINLRGLLLGGILIGALGVLDDITTAQSAAVDEIHKANPKLPFKDLYRKGISVGKEHIASLVNTLALVYISAALPVFLLFSSNQTQPLWVLLNNEFIAEEVVRILVGSTTLVLAVPIATFLATYFLTKKIKPISKLV
ncbi:MAG: YibE/F family protein [Candidatus Woykebacteria bacterium]